MFFGECGRSALCNRCPRGWRRKAGKVSRPGADLGLKNRRSCRRCRASRSVSTVPRLFYEWRMKLADLLPALREFDGELVTNHWETESSFCWADDTHKLTPFGRERFKASLRARSRSDQRRAGPPCPG